MIRRTLAVLSLAALLSVCHTAENVTVDDSDSQIQYSEGWGVTTESNDFNYGGYHHVSGDTSATANFTFTGTALYFISPKWPYNVGAQLAVDSSSPSFSDMRDYDLPFSSEGGPETVTYDVVWSMVGLANQEHTVNVSFGGDIDFLAVDGLIYTRDDDQSDSSSSDDSDRSLVIGLAVGLGIAGLLLLILLCLLIPYLRRRSEHDKESAVETVNYPILPPPHQIRSAEPSVEEQTRSGAVPVYYGGAATGAYAPAMLQRGSRAPTSPTSPTSDNRGSSSAGRRGWSLVDRGPSTNGQPPSGGLGFEDGAGGRRSP